MGRMIVHIDKKGKVTEFPHMRAKPAFKAMVDPATLKGGTRRFVQDRKTRICPRCMGLSTRENANFDCSICGNTGELEVDVVTEVSSDSDH